MSLISISGRIGSGKDTVGRIIQYLTSEYKDKYDFIEWRDRVENYGSSTHSKFEIKKFAGKLKQIASLLTGVPVEYFEDQEFKKTDLPNEWVYVKPGYPARNMTVRDFLQKLGTEAMRDGLHTNVWVNALFADYKPTKIIYNLKLRSGKTEYYGEIPNWIITDMRFPNEMEAVKSRNGITIRVVRYSESKDDSVIAYSLALTANAMKDKTGPFHPSETALDDAEFDYEIINDAGIPELIEKVKQILITEKII
jgi:hypothetical protein